VVTLFTSTPDLSVVFFLFCLFVFVVVCLVLFSLVAAAFLANKDVYKTNTSPVIIWAIGAMSIIMMVVISQFAFTTFMLSLAADSLQLLRLLWI